ncbi:MAG: sporulation protein YabP [Clostridia bacterium]|nr:sporulation protein YabP [Clostridia bacterium]MDD4146586.1 sporulation protein YabP [Clostridia bacterium]MDD4666281.1 sporulation protein YabP [Clostridia bacterium]
MEINKDTPLYQLILDNRKILQANGVTEVESFDEKQVIAVSKLGPLVVRGEGLHITQLNLEEGQLTMEGVINSFEYIEDKQAKIRARGKGVMSRLFK